eukprot:m.171715 g.171715  ORF g.171715 m.171715 type:complete len:529 (-) comp13500_c0_seq1:47-1633(-)
MSFNNTPCHELQKELVVLTGEAALSFSTDNNKAAKAANGHSSTSTQNEIILELAQLWHIVNTVQLTTNVEQKQCVEPLRELLKEARGLLYCTHVDEKEKEKWLEKCASLMHMFNNNSYKNMGESKKRIFRDESFFDGEEGNRECREGILSIFQLVDNFSCNDGDNRKFSCRSQLPSSPSRSSTPSLPIARTFNPIISTTATEATEQLRRCSSGFISEMRFDEMENDNDGVSQSNVYNDNDMRGDSAVEVDFIPTTTTTTLSSKREFDGRACTSTSTTPTTSSSSNHGKRTTQVLDSCDIVFGEEENVCKAAKLKHHQLQQYFSNGSYSDGCKEEQQQEEKKAHLTCLHKHIGLLRIGLEINDEQMMSCAMEGLEETICSKDGMGLTFCKRSAHTYTRHILEAMDAQPQSLPLQQRACSLLCESHPHSTSSLVPLHGLPLVLAAMERFPNDESIHESSFMIIDTVLSLGFDRELAAAGVVSAVIRTINARSNLTSKDLWLLDICSFPAIAKATQAADNPTVAGVVPEPK